MLRHTKKCPNGRHPPGDEIYRHDGISFFEIDGAKVHRRFMLVSRRGIPNGCMLTVWILDIGCRQEHFARTFVTWYVKIDT